MEAIRFKTCVLLANDRIEWTKLGGMSQNPGRYSLHLQVCIHANDQIVAIRED